MRIDVFKRTTDDWCGNYKIEGDCRVNGLVNVSMCQTGPNPKNNDGEFRVCVWGNDDLGMERDFGNDETLAMSVFMQVIGWEDVTINRLKTELGFWSA